METAPVSNTDITEIWNNILNVDIRNGNLRCSALQWREVRSAGFGGSSCLCVTGQDSDDTRSEQNLSLMPKSKEELQVFSEGELLKI